MARHAWESAPLRRYRQAAARKGKSILPFMRIGFAASSR